MPERKYDEELRLVAVCPSCGSDRVYQTDLLAGFGVPTVAAIECANCKKSGKSWDDPHGPGWLIQWDGSQELFPAEYAS